MLEILGTIVGLVYLWLEYKASIYLWIAGIVMPAIYLFVYFEAGLYGDFAINVYYLLAAVYGWVLWKKSERKARANGGEGLSVDTNVDDAAAWPRTLRDPQLALRLCLIFVLLFFAMAFALKYLTDSDVPWFNAFNTALSVVGMWMLAKKYIEQWWVWIVADIACTALYFYKSLYFTSCLYLFYAIIAIFGYKKWKSLMQ